MKHITVSNFTARNSTEYGSVVVAIKSLDVTRSNNTSISLGAENVENIDDRSNTSLSFQFAVFKDEEALINGAEPIEVLRVDNPNYVKGSEFEMAKTLEHFHISLSESVTNEEAKEKAYQHLIDMNTMDITFT